MYNLKQLINQVKGKSNFVDIKGYSENARTANERFYESGGVCSQTVLCEFANTSLARIFVPRHHKAAGTKYLSLQPIKFF